MQIKVVDNRTNLIKRLNTLTDNLDNVVEEAGLQLAESLVTVAPVDTGAYMDSFNVTAGRSRGGGVSSKGRPQNQAKEPYASAALARMSAQLSGMKAGVMTISNNAPHVQAVENKYRPFITARGRWSAIVTSAAAKFGFSI